MTDKQKEKVARIPAIGVTGEQPSYMYNKTIIADAVGSDNLQNILKQLCSYRKIEIVEGGCGSRAFMPKYSTKRKSL